MSKGIFSAGILIISDSRAKGEREDLTTPGLKEELKEAGFNVIIHQIVPDDYQIILETLVDWVDTKGVDLIVTSGGTGVSLRDFTPEATKAVLEKEIPGISEAIRANSLKETPYGMLSRAVAGVRNKSLIVNLPGNPKGAIDSLNLIKSVLLHALKEIKGKTDH